MSILERYAEIKDLIEQFTIVGDGVLRNDVQKYQMKYLNIIMTGVLDNSITQLVMSSHDYMILPSKYDGWGAVVNEALSQGTRVLCSENCGASVLLDKKMRGESFKLKDMIYTLKKWLGKGSLSTKDRKDIRDWANKHISGQIAANYFVDTLKGINPEVPWINAKMTV